ncbi:MAG: PLP-dependent aminotransferase family protein [Clostridia bacterium]|nr:PLP-dependent aminotransferase family protein [Clostridia bacterium]
MKKTKYLKLYEDLRKDIVNGVYPYGSRLPSKRLLAEKEDISLVSVEHAYEILCDEGYAESRQRSGYFVCYREQDGFVAVGGPEKELDQLYRNISVSESSEPTDLAEIEDFPFSVYARAMRKVLTEYGENILVKSPGSGCMQLRDAISRYLARSRGITAPPERIVIGSGAEYLYGLLVQTIGRDKLYAIEKPSYEKIEQIYSANGVKCQLLALGSDGIISSELAASSADVLHITPYRSFPSGVTASASKRREYLRWARNNGRYIVEDDFGSEFTTSTKPEETVFALSQDDNVIYLNTFSKTIAPSIRIGYMVLPEQLLKRFDEKAGFYSCSVPSFEQYVLAEFISGGDFERHINRVRRKLRKK